jgi:hypothetical protein
MGDDEGEKGLKAKTTKIDDGYCPYCGMQFAEMDTNVKQVCPKDQGGCGKSFLIRVF